MIEETRWLLREFRVSRQHQFLMCLMIALMELNGSTGDYRVNYVVARVL
jgi:hypothetical protein